MGRAQQKRGPADPLADELRWYFQEAEGDMGVASSFGGFVNLAMSGIQGGGRSNGAERRAVAIADWGATTAHRQMRERLQRLAARDTRLVHALWLAYGPTDWARVADAAFGRGTGDRLVRALGSTYVGVALLTDRLAAAGATPIPQAVSDGLNRWDLAEVTKGGDPAYRCVGPTMEARSVAFRETDTDLRARSTDVAMIDRHAMLNALPHLAGAQLDAAAEQLGLTRRRREERRIVATGRAVREEGAPSAGAMLWRIVAAAYPNKAPRGQKQKAAVDSAMRQANAIRDEAVMLLHSARNELARIRGEAPTEVERVAAKHRQRKRDQRARATRRIHVDVRGPSRPVQVYPAPELASEALLG